MTNTPSEVRREGTYPAPLYWPTKLTAAERPRLAHPLSFFDESAAVQHDYIADGWPGPCAISFRDGEFLDWMPALTIERAEQYARSA